MSDKENFTTAVDKPTAIRPMNTAWASQLTQLIRSPTYISDPRGQKTLEVIGSQVRIHMNHPVLTVIPRQLGYKFMAAEAWWILCGRDDVESIKPYSKDIVNFSDDGKTFYGAYGPMIQDQLHHCYASLARDPASRQAVLTIWRPNPPQTKDVPCTVMMQFMIRNNQLHCLVTMRSSDIWLGLPYDAFNFTMVATYLMLMLRRLPGMNLLSLGMLTVTMGSSHIYDRNCYGALQCMALNFPSWPSKGLHDVLTHFTVMTPEQLITWLHWMKDTDEGAKSAFLQP